MPTAKQLLQVINEISKKDLMKMFEPLKQLELGIGKFDPNIEPPAYFLAKRYMEAATKIPNDWAVWYAHVIRLYVLNSTYMSTNLSDDVVESFTNFRNNLIEEYTKKFFSLKYVPGDQLESATRVFRELMGKMLHPDDFKVLKNTSPKSFYDFRSMISFFKNKIEELDATVGKMVMPNEHTEHETVLKSYPNGYKWINLNRSKCRVEGRAGSHCGNDWNGRHPDDILISLRKETKIKGRSGQTVALTAVLNKGVIKELRGWSNKPPAKEFNPYILDLLSMDFVKDFKVPKHEPENNFNLNSFSEEEMKTLLDSKDGRFGNRNFLGNVPTMDLFSLSQNSPEVVEDTEYLATSINEFLSVNFGLVVAIADRSFVEANDGPKSEHHFICVSPLSFPRNLLEIIPLSKTLYPESNSLSKVYDFIKGSGEDHIPIQLHYEEKKRIFEYIYWNHKEEFFSLLSSKLPEVKNKKSKLAFNTLRDYELPDNSNIGVDSKISSFFDLLQDTLHPSWARNLAARTADYYEKYGKEYLLSFLKGKGLEHGFFCQYVKEEDRFAILCSFEDFAHNLLDPKFCKVMDTVNSWFDIVMSPADVVIETARELDPDQRIPNLPVFNPEPPTKQLVEWLLAELKG